MVHIQFYERAKSSFSELHIHEHVPGIKQHVTVCEKEMKRTLDKALRALTASRLSSRSVDDDALSTNLST